MSLNETTFEIHTFIFNHSLFFHNDIICFLQLFQMWKITLLYATDSSTICLADFLSDPKTSSDRTNSIGWKTTICWFKMNCKVECWKHQEKITCWNHGWITRRPKLRGVNWQTAMLTQKERCRGIYWSLKNWEPRTFIWWFCWISAGFCDVSN